MAEPSLVDIGRVRGFFAHPSVAVVELTAPLAAGETIYIKGHTTELRQVVESMQIDREPVRAAQAGQTVGIKVTGRCRRHDIVYALRAPLA